jgi:acetyl-CoA carboxylase biotin carboxylase subunit
MSFRAAFSAARTEAKAAFGDDSVYLEKCITEPRHVEVQVIADNDGNALHFYERDCTIQRRHQKIIEESPCPVLDENTRTELCKAALRIIREAGYVNAATVEFLLDKRKKFYFIEANTRIQVEHPVTEMVTGHDLIKWQLKIASGHSSFARRISSIPAWPSNVALTPRTRRTTSHLARGGLKPSSLPAGRASGLIHMFIRAGPSRAVTIQ